MPVETIKCQECGSTEVTEYKAGSYVCSHCDAIFKHVDPAHVTVAPAFCTCGNRIAFRCNLCHSGLCPYCDAKNPGYREGYLSDLAKIFVHTQGFGYLMRSGFDYSVTASRIVHEWAHSRDQPAFGPVISAYELLWALPDRGESAPHMCWACIAATAPIVADAVSSGAICEVPACVLTPGGRCRCCDAALCDTHLVGHAALPNNYGSPKLDVCANCIYEHIDTIVDAHPPIPGPRAKRTKRAWDRACAAWHAEQDRDRDQMVAELYALHTQGPCERMRLFDDGRAGTSHWHSFQHGNSSSWPAISYRVLDERPSTPVAPLSSVTASP